MTFACTADFGDLCCHEKRRYKPLPNIIRNVTNFGKKVATYIPKNMVTLTNLLHGEMKQLILLQITVNESALQCTTMDTFKNRLLFEKPDSFSKDSFPPPPHVATVCGLLS